MKEIIVNISNEGEIQIETRGFKGKSCIMESRFLKDVLGSEITRSLTPAYYESDYAILVLTNLLSSKWEYAQNPDGFE
jgi:hypothetical protein